VLHPGKTISALPLHQGVRGRHKRGEVLARPVCDSGLCRGSSRLCRRRARFFGRLFCRGGGRYFRTFLRIGKGERGLAPRRSGSVGHEGGRQGGQEIGLWTGGGESQTDAPRHRLHRIAGRSHCIKRLGAWPPRLERSLGTRLVTYADDLVILCRRGKADEALQRLREIDHGQAEADGERG
jgi:hypothetical protein